MLKKSLLGALLLATLILGGCSGKHIGIKEDRPLHLTEKSSSSLYSHVDTNVTAQAPMSGFYPLDDHVNSLAARIMLAQNAKKRICVQYFTFTGDKSGSILLKSLIDAANRGVQVDVVIDDIELAFHDERLALIDMHENITIRVFNPTNGRRALHYVEIGLYSDEVGRRMHNKSFIVDNSMAVYGGRNIGDLYFATDSEHFFIDNDVLVAGPMVNKLHNQFEHYFQNKLSVDFEYIAEGSNEKTKKELQENFKNLTMKKVFQAFIQALKKSNIYQQFSVNKLHLFFGNSELLYDLPEKVTTDATDYTYHIQSHLPQDIKATKQFLVTSPYFIPGEKMMKRIRGMREIGIDVAVLTNSLESTDGISVYAYYSEYQKELLEMGVRIYEIKPNAYKDDVLNQSYNSLKKMPIAMLHAKTIVIDNQYFVIGSRNMDPRSRNLNTEIVSIIESKELNAYEKVVFDDMSSLKNAYTLELEYDDNNESKVIWKTMKDGKIVKYDTDGDSSWWLRVKKNFMKSLPIRDLL